MLVLTTTLRPGGPFRRERCWRGVKDALLLCRWQRRVERNDLERATEIRVGGGQVVSLCLDFAASIFDLFFTRQEDENVTCIFCLVDHDDGANSGFEVVWLGLRCVEGLDWERSTGHLKQGGVVEVLWNLSASSVADMTISFRSDRLCTTSLSRPMRISVARVRSCASSRMMQL